MDSFCIDKHSIDFIFKTVKNSCPFEIKEKIRIPLDSDVTLREVCFLFIKKYSLSEEIFPDLYSQLGEVITNYIDNFESNFAEKVLSDRETLSSHVQHILGNHLTNDSQIAATNSKNSQNSILNGDNFYQMYHEIVHSGKFTDQLIQLELHNSYVVKRLLQDKDNCLNMVKQNHNEDNHYLKTDEKNFQRMLSYDPILDEEEQWDTKIDHTRKDQKRLFRSYIKNMHEDYIKEKNAPINNSFDSDTPNRSIVEDFDELKPEDEIQLEESYTINLGSQLKTTHNLRLISVDILKFCSTICTPHRIQTAMSLYSNSLSAIVLLVDQQILSQKGILKDFHKLCLISSENHFPEFDIQLNEINSAALEKRNVKIQNGKAQLNAGDVFLTRHSNLSEAHVVFHLVTDDSLKHQEINSRHHVILGIRNILKMAYLYDIANISIPLLLLHHMVEDCTIQWCMKRAELVLKCVKGFMIEISSSLSIAENENKTIQFVVPREISHDLFNSLSSIFPNVFRLSNTLVLTTNS